MGHFSRAQFTPPSGSTSGSATRAWFGNSELFLFGSNTPPQVFIAVTASVVAYTHLNGVSLHVHLDDWLIKTHIGRVSQTANPMVIGPLHTPRLGGKCGEVKLDSFTCSHFLGIFARYQSRPRLSLRKEDRTMALHLGGFPSGAGPACPAVVTTFGAPSFPRESSSLRPVAYPTHSVPTPLKMVSNQRSSSDPGQPGSRDPGFHSLVDNSIKSIHKGIPLGSPLVEVFLFTDSKYCGLGCSHGQKDLLRELVRGHERAAHQCAGTECDLAWSPILRGYSPRLQCCHYVRQCLCHCLSEKSGGHSVSTDVPHGHRYLRMGRRTGHNTDTQTSPWASQCVSRSSEPQRSDSENRMESESSRRLSVDPIKLGDFRNKCPTGSLFLKESSRLTSMNKVRMVWA